MGTKKPGLGKKLREGAESLVARVPTPGRRAVEWAGNVLVLRTDSADPPVFEVWHDVSQDPEALEKAVLEGERGTRLIAKSLSSLFESGLVEAP